MKNIYRIRKLLLCLGIIPVLLISCNNEDNTLAPYAGGPELSKITVQSESFRPKVTWIGGYVSVFGINKGDRPALDSTLVWLIHSEGNNIHYPVIVGQVPEGAQDITSQFGGISLDSLEEDQGYTFWVLKQEAWNQVASHYPIKLSEDTLSGASVTVSGDSLIINPSVFETISTPINVYINIVDLRTFGPLATVRVETTILNVPRISWTKPAGSDTLVAAIGFARGVSYDASGALWEAYSERDSAGIKIYVKDNVIASPVNVGESLPGTRTFIEFVPENFVRGEYYHVWIADKTWDRVNRQRFTPGYAYATFLVE